VRVGSAHDSPDESITAHPGANVNKTIVEISDRTLSILAFALALASMVTAGWAIHESSLAEREARMLQYYTLEMDAKLITAGVKKPDDSVANKLKEK